MKNSLFKYLSTLTYKIVYNIVIENKIQSLSIKDVYLFLLLLVLKIVQFTMNESPLFCLFIIRL